MDFGRVWTITKSLMLSRLRGGATLSGSARRSIVRRPLLFLLVDLCTFAAAAGVVWFFVFTFVAPSSSLNSYVSNLTQSLLMLLPTLIFTGLLVFGLVFEATLGNQFANSDTVNWMPMTPGEYVAASSLSFIMYRSSFPAAVLGATLSLAYEYGSLQAWVLCALLAIISMAAAGSVVEIMRVVLNRLSNSTYGFGGRLTLILRLGVVTGLLVLVQALAYTSTYVRALGAITPTFGPTWCVPVLWTSVSVMTFESGGWFVSFMFASFYVALASALFYGAVFARSRYWNPIERALRFTTTAYAPKEALGAGLLNTAESAIVKKDLKGLLRRREMLRVLIMPVVLTVALMVGSLGSGSPIFIYAGAFLVSFCSLLFGMASIGSEKGSIVNLLLSPIRVKDIVLGKAVPSVAFGSALGIIFYIGFVIASPFHASLVPFFLFASLALAFESTFVGLLMGLRFPNFSEGPRAGFVSPSAAFLTIPIMLVMTVLTLNLLIFTPVFETGFFDVTLRFSGCMLIAIVGSLLFYALSLRQAGRILSKMPV